MTVRQQARVNFAPLLQNIWPVLKYQKKILLLDDIPKGATGKVQRIGLAGKIGVGLMRICIYGAGAIGGYLGARLSLSGVDVTLIARGPHLQAMKKKTA